MEGLRSPLYMLMNDTEIIYGPDYVLYSAPTEAVLVQSSSAVIALRRIIEKQNADLDATARFNKSMAIWERQLQKKEAI